MNDINVLHITGRVTRDGELRYTQGGTTVFTFGVAVNESYLNRQTNQWEERANFIDCVVFGEFATKIQPYIAKGVAVTIQGHIRWSQWERDGQKRSKIECVVDHLITHRGQGQTTAPQPQPTYSAAPQTQQPTYSTPPQPQVTPPVEVYDEDIPF